jgi:hypothetical protein
MEASGQLHNTATLLSGKKSQNPLDTRLFERQNRSVRLGEETYPALPGKEDT